MIGRKDDNDIVVDDLGVARYHAELRMSRPGHYEIVDLASHNGTFVNGSRVARAVLAEDDIVTVGHTTFRLTNGELRR
ncbi:MAG TPA: FHA domain-containing protein [Trebonia sp.]|nr:FHA domain-containing protein [Trebonia sp.]